jgi:hypothetical protein
LTVTAVAAVAAGGTAAHAQSLRPHILFIFDTSGSMRENASGRTVGENTNICPGGSTSKLYGLKSALRSALAQVGTDEANLGLMSFPQVVVSNPSTSNWCGNGSWGHYDPTPSVSGVTVPNRTSTSNHSATGYPEGCLMTTNTSESTLGPWFGMGVSQILRVGVTTAAPGAVPMASDFDPVDANIPAIYRWIDNVELPTTSAAVTNPELHGLGYTPLGRSLFYARMYYDGTVKPHDPRAACRQNVVVLVTDGAETCDETTAPDGSYDLATCAGGTAPNPFHPVVQACQLFRQSAIKTYVITDSGLPSGEIANNNRIAVAGGSGSAITVSLADPNAAEAAILGIIAETVPPAEICNGRDDNCNGLIDEGVSNMCPLDTVNLTHCAVETPNCRDDNCNGLVDEGFPPNACGGPAGCPIPPEICDGLDNDCDGDIDEGFDVGAACNNGQQGGCRRLGIKECTADGTGTTCNLTDSGTGTEVCNGIDDDCNGLVDDGLGPNQGIGVECGIQGMGCQRGLTRCVAGAIVCDSTANPQPEICNGIDDDCNGLVDDGTFPGQGVGICRAGGMVCKGAAGLVCEGCTFPEAEICDGKDNDCDGTPDRDAACPSGFGCREGTCTILCMPTEFPCPSGYDCVGGFCIANRCRNVRCEVDQKCDTDTGSCVDLCHKVVCDTRQTCMRGQCLDCANSPLLACGAGMLCIDRQCVTDTCAGVKCDHDQYCADGRCLSLDCGGACGAGEKCIGGQCRPYACTASCSAGRYCDYATGTCMPDPCAIKTCPYCVQETGQCLTDPCAKVRCPTSSCYACELTPAGEPFCQIQVDCVATRAFAGSSGGGLACAAGGASPPRTGLSALLAGLCALGLLARGRRRRLRLRRLRHS